jgi:apolipoprotein N-acyltransferase
MINFTKKHRYLFSILSGLLMIVSFPFTGSLTPMVFLSWVPLLMIENNISQKKYRSGKVFIHAYIVFFIFNIGTTWWIWNADLGGAIMAFTLNALLMSITFLLFHLTKKKLGSKIGYFSLIAYWIAFEYFHYHWELSYPWLNLGNNFSILPSFVQWYSYTGVLGGTLWVLITNILVYKLVEGKIIKKAHKKTQRILLTQLIAVLLIPISISQIQYYSYSEKINPIEVVVLQPNIDPYNEKFISPLSIQLKKLCDLADPIVTKSTDIVIAPETAISVGFWEEDLHLLPFYKYLKLRKKSWGNIAFYTGASTVKFFKNKHSHASRKIEGGPGFYESYNSSLLMDEENVSTFLHKSKLVLGVEKIPFSSWLPFLEEFSINNGGTSGTLGIEKEPKVLRTNKFTFAPSICYESIYGEFIGTQCKKGAQVIFIITNDGWWGNTPGYKQHMSFARLRAIENRRSIARSANTGTSCFINQKGDIIEQSNWWESIALKQKINLNNDITFYSTFGDLLGKFLAFMSIGLLFATVFRYFKRS